MDTEAGQSPELTQMDTMVAGPPTATEQPGGSGGSGRRRLGWKPLTVALAAAVVAGGSFLLFGRKTNADAAVADAVNSSLDSHSADLVINGTATVAGKNITTSGIGAIDFQQNALQMSVNVAGGPLPITEQAVYLNKVIYLNLGPAVGEVVPGKSWVSLDLSQLSGSASSLGTGSSLSSNPTAALQALRQQGNTATELGQSTANGATVEGYSVHVNPMKVKNELAQANLPTWLKQAAESTASNADVTNKVYVDTSGHLARMADDVTLTEAGTSVTEATTMDFVHYGVPVSVSAPAAADVVSFQSFLQAAEAKEGAAGSTA
jgi:hypothetical protein